MRVEDKDLIYDSDEESIVNNIETLIPSPEDELLLKDIWDEFDDMERKVITLKSRSKTNEQIAEALKVSTRTITRKTKDIKDRLKEVI